MYVLDIHSFGIFTDHLFSNTSNFYRSVITLEVQNLRSSSKDESLLKSILTKNPCLWMAVSVVKDVLNGLNGFKRFFAATRQRVDQTAVCVCVCVRAFVFYMKSAVAYRHRFVYDASCEKWDLNSCIKAIGIRNSNYPTTTWENIVAIKLRTNKIFKKKTMRNTWIHNKVWSFQH